MVYAFRDVLANRGVNFTVHTELFPPMNKNLNNTSEFGLDVDWIDNLKLTQV